MSDDFLLELGKNPQARNLVKSLGLPIPMPQDLRRAKGPRTERPLKDRDVALFVPSGSALLSALATGLVEAGANPFVVETPGTLAAFEGPGEAYGRTAVELDPESDRKYHAAVLDGTALASAEDLKALWAFFRPLMRKLKTSGRLVVIGRPPEGAENAAEASAQAALEGFVRSAAKELGKKGTTAQLLRVENGAEAAIAGPLRFFLSERSAYVSGQPLTVSATAGAPTGSWVCPLERNVALVTGAARGIGRATARILADEGATVVCLDRPADDGPTAKLAREINGDVLLQDVTDPEAPQNIATYLKEQHGGVDIVVHNAGITRDRTLANLKEPAWDLTLDVNLGAVLRMTSELMASGVLRDHGRLICLSSRHHGQRDRAGHHRDATDGGDPVRDPRGGAPYEQPGSGWPAGRHRPGDRVSRHAHRAGDHRADAAGVRRLAGREVADAAQEGESEIGPTGGNRERGSDSVREGVRRLSEARLHRVGV